MRIVLSLALVLFAACSAEEKPVVSHQTADQVHESPAGQVAAEGVVGEDGVRTVTVQVKGVGYEPATIAAKAGEKLRINFARSTEPNCGDEVVFADLGIKQALPAGQTTAVEITPQKSGELKFTCGMNMYEGKVVVQ
jgi:plastocyanin domain-containing protein